MMDIRINCHPLMLKRSLITVWEIHWSTIINLLKCMTKLKIKSMFSKVFGYKGKMIQNTSYEHVLSYDCIQMNTIENYSNTIEHRNNREPEVATCVIMGGDLSWTKFFVLGRTWIGIPNKDDKCVARERSWRKAQEI